MQVRNQSQSNDVMDTGRVNLRDVVSHRFILTVGNYVDNLATMVSVVHQRLDMCGQLREMSFGAMNQLFHIDVICFNLRDFLLQFSDVQDSRDHWQQPCPE